MSILKFLRLDIEHEGSSRTSAETDTVRKIASALDQMDPEQARFIAAFAYLMSRVARADLILTPDEITVMEKIVMQQAGIHSDEGGGDLRILPAERQELNDIPKYVVDRTAGILDRLGDAVKASQLICPCAQQIAEAVGRFTPVRHFSRLALGHRPLM